MPNDAPNACASHPDAERGVREGAPRRERQGAAR